MSNFPDLRSWRPIPDVYEHFMGRWSTRPAKPFLEFAGVQPGDRVLDIGCGTKTDLSPWLRTSKVIGMDASESSLDGARRLRPHRECHI